MMPSLFSVIIKQKHVRSNLDFVAKDMLVRIITMQKIEEEIRKSSNTDRRPVRLSKKSVKTGKILKSVIKVTIAQCATREPNNSSIRTFIRVQSVMICNKRLIVRGGPFVPLLTLSNKNMTKMDTTEASDRGPTRMPSLNLQGNADDSNWKLDKTI
jgi:hypothetical protein